MRNIILFFYCLLFISAVDAQSPPWIDHYDSSTVVNERILPPEGYCRVVSDTGSFASWLRQLPLKAENSPVHLYDGSLKLNQKAHYAVMDIDVGRRNLQQCADAVIRLRAEYLYSKNWYDSISFVFTSGDVFPFRKWIAGARPVVRDSDVSFVNTAKPDSSYGSFRKYLDIIFTYAGSYSLEHQMPSKGDNSVISVGDVFIRGGFPGHAVIVIDKAVDSTTGNEIFLLAQSYMPAQEIHILINPNNEKLSPWYDTDFGDTLVTPEWVFERGDLRRF